MQFIHLLLFYIYKGFKGGVSLENKIQSARIVSHEFDHEWIHLIKQAKDMGLTPLEVRIFLQKTSSEAGNSLSRDIRKLVADAT